MSNDIREFHPQIQNEELWTALPNALQSYRSQIHDTSLLHILATDPSRVLPPGKGLSSLFPRFNGLPSNEESEVGMLEKKIASAVHSAFWDEATRSLSSESPGIVMARLTALYRDLHSVLCAVLPDSSPVLQIFSAPLSPTSSPLRSALNHLREVIEELRKRVAPSRDTEVDQIMQFTLSNTEYSELPVVLAHTFRSIFTLVEEMAKDLRNFNLAKLSEPDLQLLITEEARRREMELVGRLYGGEKAIQALWDTWRKPPWTAQLINALGAETSMSITPPPFTEPPPELGSSPTPHDDRNGLGSNALPPTFLIQSPALFRIQNLLQAVCICACLRLLFKPTLSSAVESDATGVSDAKELTLSRLWTLLYSEVNRAGHEPAETHLINLEDEVIAAFRGQIAVSDVTTDPSVLLAEQETKVRKQVQRLLRTEDPVFRLFMLRLVSGLTAWVGTATDRSPPTPHGPTQIRSGRTLERSRKEFPSLIVPLSATAQPQSRMPEIQGFGGRVLTDAINNIALEIALVIEWVRFTWADII